MTEKKRKIRRTNENIAKVQLQILGDLFKNKHPSISDIFEEYDYPSERTVRDDIAKLRSLGIRVSVKDDHLVIAPLGLEGLWEGTVIGARLKKNIQSKQRLAKKGVDFLKTQESIYSIILGTGTTMYELTKELVGHLDELHVNNIYTTNLLVVREFIHEKVFPEVDPKIHMVQGRLNIRTGSLFSEKGVKYLSDLRTDAVFTSFDGLDRDRITTGQYQEMSEKIMNIKPAKECKYVIILIEWLKIAKRGPVIVEEEEGKGSANLLDFCPGRKYIIITDPPGEEKMSEGKNPERRKILKYWQDKGVEIVYTKE